MSAGLESTRALAVGSATPLKAQESEKPFRIAGTRRLRRVFRTLLPVLPVLPVLLLAAGMQPGAVSAKDAVTTLETVTVRGGSA